GPISVSRLSKSTTPVLWMDVQRTRMHSSLWVEPRPFAVGLTGHPDTVEPPNETHHQGGAVSPTQGTERDCHHQTARRLHQVDEGWGPETRWQQPSPGPGETYGLAAHRRLAPSAPRLFISESTLLYQTRLGTVKWISSILVDRAILQYNIDRA